MGGKAGNTSNEIKIYYLFLIIKNEAIKIIEAIVEIIAGSVRVNSSVYLEDAQRM